MSRNADGALEESLPKARSLRSFGAGFVADSSSDEQIAILALRRYFPTAHKIEIYDDVPEYGDGTLFLAIASPGIDDQGKVEGPYEYQVLVRNGRGVVYTDFSQTLRQGARLPHWISRYVAPDTVLATLSLIIVIAGVAAWYYYGGKPESATVITAISGAMTTVLGYWFGRMSAPGDASNTTQPR